jgi:predicted amidohydrolase
MKSIRVAAVQMNGLLGKTERNLEEIESWSIRAAEQGAELVLFPELAIHGHWMAPECWSVAEAVPDGPSIKRLEQVARERQLVLCVGMSEKEKDLIYNCQVLIGPQGYIGKSRKIHMSEDEGLMYVGGSAIPVFDIGKCKVGSVICYDAFYPEITRTLALKGAEVFLMPSAGRCGPWNQETEQSVAMQVKESLSWYRMRALANAAFVVITNQAGRAGTVEYYREDYRRQPYHGGGSLMFAPDGSLLAETEATMIQADMILADLKSEDFAQARSNANFPLRKRRPELYGELIRPVTEA